jgi:uncharacterized protein with beta-barrel porin domain
VQVAGGTASQAIVGGSSSLNGATVEVAANSPTARLLGFHPAQLYTILTTGGALSANDFFNPNIALVNGTIGDWTITYDPNHAYLAAVAYTTQINPPAGASQNASNAAGAINAAINSGATLPGDFQNLSSLSGGALNSALNQLAGQQQGAFALSGLKADNMFLNLMLNPDIDGRSDYGGLGSSAEKLGFSSVWGSVYGGGGVAASANASTGVVRTTANAFGVATGVDYRIRPGALVGFALSGGGTNFGLGQGMGGGSSSMVQVGGFGVYNLGPVDVSGSLAYSAFDVTTNRSGELAGVGAQSGRFVANALSNRLEFAYGLPLTGNFKLSPYVANQIQAMWLPRFAESSFNASDLSLAYAARFFAADRAEFGARFDWSYPGSNGKLKIYAKAAWAHDFTNQWTSLASFQSLPGGNFAVKTGRPAPNSALVALGADYSLGGGWSLGAKLDGEVSNATNIYSASAILRNSW